jgi:type II secretory pathway component GspD/PulD (secretin)
MKVWLLLAVLLASLSAVAQKLDPVSAKPVSFEFHNAELRDVLKVAFRQVGVSYSVDPGLNGRVTISVKNKPFIHALRDVMIEVDGIYFIEAGIYQFRPLTRRMPPQPPPKPVSLPGLAPGSLLINPDRGKDIIILGIQQGQADLQLLLKEMFAIAGKEYWMDRSLHGLVTVPPNYNSDVEAALTAMLKQVNGWWHQQHGVYVILRRDGPMKWGF